MKKNKKIIKIILLSLVTIFVVLIITLSFLFYNLNHQLHKNNLDQASKLASTTLILVKPLSNLTLQRSNTIEFGRTALELIANLPTTIDTLSKAVQPCEAETYFFDLNKPQTTITELNSQLKLLNKHIENSKLLRLLINKERQAQLKEINIITTELNSTLTLLTAEPQKWLVIFQNSDELRATGGFMGSYALVDIYKGLVTNIEIEDIYDADGQFQGYIEAPSAVNKYLSGNNGLRLPDSNWDPDFEKSSQQILQFFALSNRHNIKGVVAVNLDFAKELLALTGDIELVDYNTIINHDNVNTVLRTRRDEFFPGSNQKKHMLSQLINQIKIKLANSNQADKINLLKLINQQIKISNLQFYSLIPDIDKIFSHRKMRKNVNTQQNNDYLFLVESNVGINKANAQIDRQVTINNLGNKKEVSIQFQNNNLPPTTSKLTQLVNPEAQTTPQRQHLGYVNYQRVLFPTDWQLNSIKYNGQLIDEYDIAEYQDGENNLMELGFLLTLKEQASGKLELIFDDATPNDHSIFIQKQAGTSPTIYQVIHNDVNQHYMLDLDQVIEYP